MKNLQGFKDNMGKVMNASMVSMLAMVIISINFVVFS